ncbi:MAG: WXG100 family type VII secretion target [Actinobacteria bacterium]|nr:WXG100 family type VII secretion target [Actinomycetota bacterium]
MAVQGMDIDQVRQVAAWLNEMSNEIENYTHRATAMVQTVVGQGWQGPDAEQFRSNFADHVRPSLFRSIEVLRDMVQQAHREVAQQEAASGS